MQRYSASYAWTRYAADRSFYFWYPISEGTLKLIKTGEYGVVQLKCIVNTAHKAYMAGYRAGRRSKSTT
jgi:hypothetical protein